MKKTKRIRGSLWKHKNHKYYYQGGYRQYGKQRNFVLIGVKSKNGKPHKITFESWQMAERMGWRKA